MPVYSPADRVREEHRLASRGVMNKFLEDQVIPFLINLCGIAGFSLVLAVLGKLTFLALTLVP